MEQIISNRELILVAYANEGPVTDAHLKIRETQLDVGSVGKDGSPGDVAVQNLWISVDPYLRQLMKQSDDGLYMPSFQLNQVCLAMIFNPLLRSVCISIIATSFMLLLCAGDPICFGREGSGIC
jgi:NADPH-dependent curcumin reductase CurA